MARPSKITPDMIKIGENVALVLPYSLAAESSGTTYQTFNDWMTKGKNSISGEYYQFSQYIEKRDTDATKKILARLNTAADAGNCQVCM